MRDWKNRLNCIFANQAAKRNVQCLSSFTELRQILIRTTVPFSSVWLGIYPKMPISWTILNVDRSSSVSIFTKFFSCLFYKPFNDTVLDSSTGVYIFKFSTLEPPDRWVMNYSLLLGEVGIDIGIHRGKSYPWLIRIHLFRCVSQTLAKKPCRTLRLGHKTLLWHTRYSSLPFQTFSESS